MAKKAERFDTTKLIDAVIEEMEKQVLVGDWTAIEELLCFVPRENLIQFLPEEDWDKFKE